MFEYATELSKPNGFSKQWMKGGKRVVSMCLCWYSHKCRCWMGFSFHPGTGSVGAPGICGFLMAATGLVVIN